MVHTDDTRQTTTGLWHKLHKGELKITETTEEKEFYYINYKIKGLVNHFKETAEIV